MSTSKLYAALLDKIVLTDAHRESLRKRGLTDEVIDRAKFRSGGPDLEAAIHGLGPKGDLIEANLLVTKPATRCNPKLIKDTILIPYFDRDGNCTMIRPHRDHLAGVRIQSYVPVWPLRDPVIITEGEFKAWALEMYSTQLDGRWGALSIPGISSFGAKHLPELVSLLEGYKIRTVLIGFDNEIKSIVGQKNFKSDPQQRWDTPFWAYVMSELLSDKGFISKIIHIPDDWRVGGKIDWDGALAAGRTAEEVAAVVTTAVDREEYITRLPEEAQSVIRSKLHRREVKSEIRREGNKYVATRDIQKIKTDVLISNFVFDILNNYMTPEGCLRECRIVNESGEVSATFMFSGEHLSSVGKFKPFVIGMGNFQFFGQDRDLDQVVRLELSRHQGRVIFQPDHIGYLQEQKVSMYANVLYDSKGARTDPDDDGIFWIKDVGYKPTALITSTGKDKVALGIPVICLDEDRITRPWILEVADKLCENFGTEAPRLGIGWIIASLFSNSVYPVLKSFPLMFVSGKRRSGKTTLAEWLLAMSGIEGKGSGINDTTAVALGRGLAYYSNLPYMLDEYRNTREVRMKMDGLLRSIYNRQMAAKGIKASFGVRSVPVRGSLIVAGEETPEDNALLSRCLLINLREDRMKGQHFKWLNAHASEFSALVALCARQAAIALPEAMGALMTTKEHLEGLGLDKRTAINFAVPLVFYTAFLEPNLLEKRPEFVSWVVSEAKETYANVTEEDLLHTFFEDLALLIRNGEIGSRIVRVEGNSIYLYFKGAFSAWAEHIKRVGKAETFKEAQIKRYIAEQPWCLSKEKVVRLEKLSTKVMEFDMERGPGYLEDVANALPVE